MTTLRIHPPAGKLEPKDWIRLSQEAADKADGFIYLCENSAFQLCNVKTDPSPEITGLHCAVVLPSPLSQPARDLAVEIATRLPTPQTEAGVTKIQSCPTPRIGVDGGDGDVAQLGLEVCVRLQAGTADVESAGTKTHNNVALADIFTVVHKEFSRAKDQALKGVKTAHTQAVFSPPVGWLPSKKDAGTVSLGAAVAGGVLPAAYAEMIGRMEVATSITPWGGLMFHDLPEEDADVVLRFLAPRGFIFDAHSPLLNP